MAVAWLAALCSLCAQAGPGTRDPAGTREQCEALTHAAVAMAQELLRNHGEFPPYGLGLSAGDEVVELGEGGAQEGMRAADASDALRAKLADALKAHAVQATALVYEAALLMPPSEARGEAIAIQLAHRDGYRAVIVVPYRFQGGDVVLGPSQVIEHKGDLPRARPKRKAR